MISSVSGMGGGMMGMQGAQHGRRPEQAFSKMDGDGDGALSAVELQQMSDRMTEKLGNDAPSSDDLLAQFDGDGDGAISFAEFEAMRPQGPPVGGPGGGMMRPYGSGGSSSQMDLSSLFGDSEEEDTASEDESIYAYA